VNAPGDLVVGEQPAAVVTESRFLAEVEEEAGVILEVVVGPLDGFDDPIFDLLAEALVDGVAVNGRDAGGVVGVGGVEEDVSRRDAGRALNFGEGAVDEIARQEQNVDGTNGDLRLTRLFDDDGGAAKLALLPGCLAGSDAAGDDHRVVRFEVYRGGADAKFTRT
jgi:hypothetical protein